MLMKRHLEGVQKKKGRRGRCQDSWWRIAAISATVK